MAEKAETKNNNSVILALLFLASGLLYGLVGYFRECRSAERDWFVKAGFGN